jgi:hypothetical protein
MIVLMEMEPPSGISEGWTESHLNNGRLARSMPLSEVTEVLCHGQEGQGAASCWNRESTFFAVTRQTQKSTRTITRLPETDPLPSNGSGWQRLLFFALLLLLMSKMNRVRRFKDFRSVFLVDAFSC